MGLSRRQYDSIRRHDRSYDPSIHSIEKAHIFHLTAPKQRKLCLFILTMAPLPFIRLVDCCDHDTMLLRLPLQLHSCWLIVDNGAARPHLVVERACWLIVDSMTNLMTSMPNLCQFDVLRLFFDVVIDQIDITMWPLNFVTVIEIGNYYLLDFEGNSSDCDITW